jgi:hypothetical protein
VTKEAAMLAEVEAQGLEWVNLSEAARRIGWPREKLRSSARRGRVRSKRASNSGELLILLTPELTHGLSETAYGPNRKTMKAEERLTALEAVMVDAEAQVADLRAELAESRAEARLLREALDRDRARSDRLEAAMVEARKPVLVRLLEAVRRR